jgi:hypothetical protein
MVKIILKCLCGETKLGNGLFEGRGGGVNPIQPWGGGDKCGQAFLDQSTQPNECIQ